MDDAGGLRSELTAGGEPSDPAFRAMFHATPAPMLLLAADPPRFTMVQVNPAHARAFRTTAEALIGHGLFEVFPADPDPVTAAFIATIRGSMERVMATGAPDQISEQPYAVVGADGGTEERYWGSIQTPIRDAAGQITHILSNAYDVTASVLERRGAEARALLMREVDHRARNALTVVQSVLRLTEARDIAEFREVALGRVEVLARAQTSLARRKWEGADLAELVQAELAALAPQGRYAIGGPAVTLPAEKVQALSMVMHELATNAMKYGALSVAGGRIEVSWTLEPGRLAMTWCESRGPPVVPPARTGFGSRLIRQLGVQLGGQVVKDWRPEGLCVTVDAAL